MRDTGPGLLDDVRRWYANPSSNFGWLLRGNETHVSAGWMVMRDEKEVADPRGIWSSVNRQANDLPPPSAGPDIKTVHVTHGQQECHAAAHPYPPWDRVRSKGRFIRRSRHASGEKLLFLNSITLSVCTAVWRHQRGARVMLQQLALGLRWRLWHCSSAQPSFYTADGQTTSICTE